jgi:FemAB-related protein (PEP-CTERM system-associated)
MATLMNDVNIRFAAASDRLSWDTYVLGHPNGTAYQLFAWGMAVERAYGFRRIYLLAEHEGQICGVFPAIDFRTPLIGRRWISLPYCDSGGILADHEEVAQALWERGSTCAAERHCGCIIRSNHSLPFGGENRTDKVRMVLELPENSEKLLADLKSKLRSQVKKPLRDGLSARIGAGDLVTDFYRIFAENMRDLGSPAHSRKWMEAIIESYGQRIRVSVVYAPDGTAAAAGIILLHHETVNIPWASSLRRYNSLNPNMLLYWTFLAFAADSGYKRFDFGRSSPGEGTWRFKEQWGAVPKPLFWYEMNATGKNLPHPKNSINSSRNRQLVAALWSKLPALAINWLGPRIRKYISL